MLNPTGIFQVNTHGLATVSWTTNTAGRWAEYEPPEALDFFLACSNCNGTEKSFTFHLASDEEVANGLHIMIKPEPHLPEYPYVPNTWQCIDCWLGEHEDWIDVTTGEWDLDLVDEEDIFAHFTSIEVVESL
jgi:hypothetical protein